MNQFQQPEVSLYFAEYAPYISLLFHLLFLVGINDVLCRWDVSPTDIADVVDWRVGLIRASLREVECNP